MKELRIFVNKQGKEPFSDWLRALKDKQTRARIRTRLDRLIFGNYGDYKAITQDVYELRLKFGPGYRIYFTETSQEIIILLCAGSKTTQVRDIKKAIAYSQELRGTSL